MSLNATIPVHDVTVPLKVLIVRPEFVIRVKFAKTLHVAPCDRFSAAVFDA